LGGSMPRITKRARDALITKGNGATLRDDDLRGFACRLNGNGSISYYIEYRAGRGRVFSLRRLVIGRHGPFTPEEARQAKELLAQVACGRDPAGELALRKREPTIRDLLMDTLERHWRTKSKASTVKSFVLVSCGLLVENAWWAEAPFACLKRNRDLAMYLSQDMRSPFSPTTRANGYSRIPNATAHSANPPSAMRGTV
jgi:hypothetical protein